MDPKTYREELLGKLRRVESFGSSAAVAPTQPGINDVPALMRRAEDQAAAVKDRVAAIEAINRIAFDLMAFKQYNADYREVLKDLRSDKSSKVRQAAFERLALSMDHATRRMLQSSLSGDGDKLVPDAVAAALLGVDDHDSSRDVLRDAVEGRSQAVRKLALRGLASDPKSADLMERIATDQAEDAELREVATMSLKVAAPKRFAEVVQKIAMDSGEDDRLKTTALSSLALSPEALAQVKSKSFLADLDAVARETKSIALKTSIKQLKSRTE